MFLFVQVRGGSEGSEYIHKAIQRTESSREQSDDLKTMFIDLWTIYATDVQPDVQGWIDRLDHF